MYVPSIITSNFNSFFQTIWEKTFSFMFYKNLGNGFSDIDFLEIIQDLLKNIFNEFHLKFIFFFICFYLTITELSSVKNGFFFILKEIIIKFLECLKDIIIESLKLILPVILNSIAEIIKVICLSIFKISISFGNYIIYAVKEIAKIATKKFLSFKKKKKMNKFDQKQISQRFSSETKIVLQAAYEKTPYSTGINRKVLSDITKLSENQIQDWFRNQRRKNKKQGCFK